MLLDERNLLSLTRTLPGSIYYEIKIIRYRRGPCHNDNRRNDLHAPGIEKVDTKG